ncbi:MAG: acyltransferase family protein [Heteroscytonema crispum UTEX LB 1556]
MTNNNRLDALLALRGFACFMVVIFHCEPPRDAIIYKGHDLSWLIFSHGMVAVWIFFVLSGYLIGKVFYTKRYNPNVSGTINFWRNRAIRIFPLYYFAVLILTVLVYPDWLKTENWGYLIRVCTFTYDGSPQLQSSLNFNGVFWSLSTEVQFYLVIPFIYSFFQDKLSNKKQVLLAGGSIIILTLIIRSFFWITFRSEMSEKFSYAFKYWYAPLITNFDLFLCGFLVNAWLQHQYQIYQPKILKRLKIPTLFKKQIAVILIVIMYFFTAHHIYNQELWSLKERAGSGLRTTTTIFILPVVTALITSFFIWVFEKDSYYCFTKNEKLSFSSILINPIRILEVFGNLSYGVYIWHQPIIEKMKPIFTSEIPIEAFYARFTATLILSIFLASATYYFVELPSSKWKISRQTEKSTR